MSDMNIYQRINAVMKSVSYVQKDATISGGGSYKAVTHDQVISVVRKSMVENGIVVRVEQLRSDIPQMRDIKNDIKMHLYTGDYAVHFVNMDKPEDCCTTTINAHANDNGDKAPGKAASYAVKYAILKTFSLETGESDESRTAEYTPYTDIQKEEFDELLEEKKALQYLVYTKTVGEEVMHALNDSFPKGKISQGKRDMRQLETDGWGVVKDYAGRMKECISTNDSHGLLELVAELEPVERKLVGGLLDANEIQAVKQVQELGA